MSKKQVANDAKNEQSPAVASKAAREDSSQFDEEGWLKFKRPQSWHQVADVAFEVFRFLGPEELRLCAQLNSSLGSLAVDEELWEWLLLITYGIDHQGAIARHAEDQRRASMLEQARRSEEGPHRRRRMNEREFFSSGTKMQPTAKNTERNTDVILQDTAKATFKQEWKYPRQGIFKAVQELRRIKNIYDYQQAQSVANGYASQAASLGLGSFFEEAAKRSQALALRLSMIHQLKFTALCGCAMGGLGWLHATKIGAGQLASDSWNELLSAPLKTMKSAWLLPLVGGSLVVGLFRRLQRQQEKKRKYPTAAHNNRPNIKSLSFLEKSGAILNYAIKELNDGLLSYMLIPLCLVTTMRGVDVYHEHFSESIIVRWVGTIALILFGIAGIFARGGQVFVIPAFLLGLCFALKVPVVYSLMNSILAILALGLVLFGVLWGTFSVADWLSGPRQSVKRQARKDKYITAFFTLMGLGSAKIILNETIYGYVLEAFGSLATLRFLPNALGGGDLKPSVADAAKRASLYLLTDGLAVAKSASPLTEAVALLSIASIVNRFGAFRAATVLYGKRWATHPIVAVLFDAISVRIFITDGLGPAIALRVLASTVYILASG